jgi:hypothetical protein
MLLIAGLIKSWRLSCLQSEALLILRKSLKGQIVQHRAPNNSVKGTACKLRLQVPSALRATAAPYLKLQGHPREVNKTSPGGFF